MKKLILIFFIIFTFYFVIGHLSTFVIPDEALRIRIIANSNSNYDQKIKNALKEKLQYKLYKLLKNTKGIEDARKVISNNLAMIDNEVKKELTQLNYKLDYDINFGLNYFPSKEYKGITYNEGYYESLVITLGEGLGDNWWCVLFPPLCLLEAEESTEIEYTSLVKEILNKYLKTVD